MTGTEDDNEQTYVLSIVERPFPPDYPHMTLECLFCFGGMRPSQDGQDIVHAARREGLEETGILLPHRIFAEATAAANGVLPGALPNRQIIMRNHAEITMLAVRLPCGARADVAYFIDNNEGQRNIAVDNLTLESQKWGGKRYVNITLD